MADIINLLYLRKYEDIFKFYLLKNKPNVTKIPKITNNFKGVYNPLSRFVFIVSDLGVLLDNLRNLQFEGVNAGSQKFRGSLSYIGYINTSLDQDFRHSLYRHYNF